MNYEDFDPEGQKIKLFSPGPTQFPDWILAELAKPNDTHRAKSYAQMHESVVKQLKILLNTNNDIFLMTSSGTGIMEACVRNLVSDEDEALFFSIGDFGTRWYEIGTSNGKKCDVVTVEPGKALTPAIVKEHISKKKYAVVFLTMNETSTGVLNRVDELAPIIKETGALLCVDAVSCMGGVKIEVDKWGLDVCLASLQKCFATPSGMAIAAVSAAALKKAETVKNRGTYFDFIIHKKLGDKNNTPTTPAIPIIRALNKMLNHILNEEGAEARYARHKKNAELIQNRMVKLGFEMMTEEGYHSPTVCTIKNNKNMDVKAFVKAVANRGFRITDGYGTMAGKAFRISAMGEHTEKDINELIDVIEIVLKEMKIIE